jgi:hypothetical protein
MVLGIDHSMESIRSGVNLTLDVPDVAMSERAGVRALRSSLGRFLRR